MPINDFKVLPRYSEISVLSFTFTSNKVFYFSQINVFIAFRLSKIYLQSERKAWFCLAKNFRFFILKNIRFFIQKKEALLEKSYSWIFYFRQVNLFIACHLSKIYLQSERKAWFYLPNTFDFLFQNDSTISSEKRVVSSNSCSWI